MANLHCFSKNIKIQDKKISFFFGMWYYFSIFYQCYIGRIVIKSDSDLFQLAQRNQV